MKISQQALADVCRRYGKVLQGLPAGIDGTVLLWAIAGNESSFGANIVARHEPEYCPQELWHERYSPGAEPGFISRPGRYSADPRQQQLHKNFGCLACCSFTPWQIMAAHAVGYTPLELLSDLEKGAEAVVGFLNREIPRREPKTLAHFASIWNGATSAEYIAELGKNYAAALPA